VDSSYLPAKRLVRASLLTRQEKSQHTNGMLAQRNGPARAVKAGISNRRFKVVALLKVLSASDKETRIPAIKSCNRYAIRHRFREYMA